MDASSVLETIWPAAKQAVRGPLYGVLTASIRAAVREQGLADLEQRLHRLCPDVTHQYTSWEVTSDYFLTKIRAQHAFQVALASRALAQVQRGVVMDVGDSSGTHIQYLQGLYPNQFTFLSVNRDTQAVERIRAKGLQALCGLAEEVAPQAQADVVLSFEMLEHLPNPTAFLHALSERSACRFLVVTVPYVRQSRVGLHHIRQRVTSGPVNAERTHLFELSPPDWRLLFAHAGWRVEEHQIYRQYPRYSWLRVAQPLWKTLDFEGFYGAIFVRDQTWASRYTDW